MPLKLVDDNEETIFEFENDALACALLLRVIGQAKHGEDLRAEITLNEHVDSLARAVIRFAEESDQKRYANAGGHYPSPPSGVSWNPAPAWAYAVLRLIFDTAPTLKWWTLSTERKREIVTQAFYPHRLSEETLTDFWETIDFWVRRYRAE